MSIKCICRNGHKLRVKDSLAGRVGLCPVCRAEVRVPRPQPVRCDCLSEDAILHILGKHTPAPHQDTTTQDTVEDLEAFADTSLSGINLQGVPKKCCDRCNQEVPAGTHICPYCHTYIASLKDF